MSQVCIYWRQPATSAIKAKFSRQNNQAKIDQKWLKHRTCNMYVKSKEDDRITSGLRPSTFG